MKPATQLPAPRWFRKKPVVIEAVQYLGSKNIAAVLFWMGTHQTGPGPKSGFVGPDGKFIIRTLESNEFVVSEGDWVIRGIRGEFYACKPDIFEATYEEAA
jgi:hypothetical protein